jgi:hypothetical protein
VTVETFTAWKQTFQSELDKAKKMEKDEKDTRKLTGKELFMQDKTLNESDLKFLEEGIFIIKAISFNFSCIKWTKIHSNYLIY